MDWKPINDSRTAYGVEHGDEGATLRIKEQKVEFYEEERTVYKVVLSLHVPDYSTGYRKILGVDLAKTEAEEILDDMLRKAQLWDWEGIEEVVG